MSEDSKAFNDQQLSRLERRLAAIVRQYQRAVAALDHPAEKVECEGICDCVRWLCYHHLDLRVGMSSYDWIWLDCQYDCQIEWLDDLKLRASGRLDCSLPEGRKQWTEPFEALITHSETGAKLCDYTIWLGNRATFLNVQKIRQLIESGEVVSPPVPHSEDEWAFLFHLADRD